MAYYRLYVRYRAADGRIVDVHEIDAVDDSEAMQIAGTYPEDFLELWQEERCVTAFEVDRRQSVAA